MLCWLVVAVFMSWRLAPAVFQVGPLLFQVAAQGATQLSGTPLHSCACLPAGNAALAVTNAGSGSPVAISVGAGGSTGVSVPSDLTLNSLTVGTGGVTVSCC